MSLVYMALWFILVGFSQAEISYEETPGAFPQFSVQNLDELKSASFNSFNRLVEIIKASEAFNQKLDKYLKDKFKHNAFTKEYLFVELINLRFIKKSFYFYFY